MIFKFILIYSKKYLFIQKYFKSTQEYGNENPNNHIADLESQNYNCKFN